jgi:hypothetical protein
MACYSFEIYASRTQCPVVSTLLALSGAAVASMGQILIGVQEESFSFATSYESEDP